MMWFFLGALVLVGVFVSAISGASKRNEEIHKQTEKTKLIDMRAKSYADYLKRTSPRADIAAMTESELIEHTFDAIRTFNKQIDETVKGILGLCVAVVTIVGFVFLADGPKGPAIFLGGMALTGLVIFYSNETKKIADAYVAKGFEIDRLKIEG